MGLSYGDAAMTARVPAGHKGAKREGPTMPGDKGKVDSLSKAVKACKGNAVCIQAAENEFVAGGGTMVPVNETGKVFTDPNGGKVFVTPSGKVF